MIKAVNAVVAALLTLVWLDHGTNAKDRLGRERQRTFHIDV